MKINNSKGFETVSLIVIIAVIGLVSAAGYGIAIRSKKPVKLPPAAQPEPSANEPVSNEEVGLDNLATTEITINPVSIAEFDALVNTSPASLQPAYTPKPATIYDYANPKQLQSVIVKQSDASVKIYVGRLHELSVGKWQLLTAFELVTHPNGEKSLLGVAEMRVDSHIEFDSQTVVAWTNLPETHEYAKAIRSFEASGIE